MIESRTNRALSVVLATALSGCALARDNGAGPPPDGIGRVVLRTMPLPKDIVLRSATYAPSGKVLVSYSDADGKGERWVKLATVDDDGRDFRKFFSQEIPVRAKENGLRFMVFPDDRRILLGDYVIECAQPLERCDAPKVVPVAYPAELENNDRVFRRWSEIVVSPDNRHMAWTTLLSDYSAVVFVGELVRRRNAYVVADPRIISTTVPYRPDPEHPGGVIPNPVRGGEVKQFVQGGAALSLVGAAGSDLGASVVQDLRTGEVEPITHTPGYTETTIFSPDGRLGMTMTARFSPKSDLAILGLLPRPYSASLNMGLTIFAYTYSVAGVRLARPGNIGPELIDIPASMARSTYEGKNLASGDDWVFMSPMSWSAQGHEAMWIEQRRLSHERRIRIAATPDYEPGKPVPARRWPAKIAGSSVGLSSIALPAGKDLEAGIRVYGRVSGYIDFRQGNGRIDKSYVDYSDNGRSKYSGEETMLVNPGGRSTYSAHVRLSGPKPGEMDLTITFGPLTGDLPARIDFDRDASGLPMSRGYAAYNGKRLEVGDLVP